MTTKFYLRLCCLCLAGLLACTYAKSVAAHAELTRSEPSDGTTLTDAPRSVQLWFNEAIAPRFSAVQILDAQGQALPDITLRVDPLDPKVLLVDLPKAPAGAYTLFWQVLSEVDGHFSQGLLLFGIKVAAPTDPVITVQPTLAPWSERLLRWLNFICLAGIVGALGVALFLHRSPARTVELGRASNWQQVQQRLYQAAAWWVLGAGVIGCGLAASQLLTLQQTTANDISWWQAGRSLLSETRWGSLWLARQGVLLLLGALLLWPRAVTGRSRPTRWQTVLLIDAGLALLVIQALMGHAAGNTRNSWLAVTVTTLHLLAASFWVGGLFALWVGWLPLIRRQPERRNELWWLALQPFTRPALISVGLLIATGLYNTGQQLPSLDALLLSSYGQLLLGKLGLVLLMGGIGLLNTFLLRPAWVAPLAGRLGRPNGWRPVSLQRLPLLVGIELLVGAVILLATGVMTATPPPRGPVYTLAPEEEVSSLSQQVDDLQVMLEVKPSRPGPNVFSVRTASIQEPAPAEIIRVLLRFTYLDEDLGRVSVKAEEIEPGRYLLNGNYLKLAGPWQIEVVTRRYGIEDSVAQFHWLVLPTAPVPATLLSKRPLAAPLRLAALLIFALGSAGLLAWRWRWGRRSLRLSAFAPTGYATSRPSLPYDSSPIG